jgi:hypothetical protein
MLAGGIDMSKRSCITIASVFLSISASTAAAGAAQYQANFPPPSGASEVNASQDGTMANARSLIAAARMAGKFYNNANLSVPNQESIMLATCKANTSSTSSWPEHCDFGGIVKTMNAQPDFGHGWTQLVYDGSSQSMAMNAQKIGLKSYKSPSIVPIYGQADHWATIYEIITDANDAISKVKFFDACIGFDFEGNSCWDGNWVQQTGATWSTFYYKIVAGPTGILSVNDPYYGKFLVSYDPPEAALVEQDERAARSMDATFAAAPSVLDEGEEMDATIAEERVWYALAEAGVDQDPVLWPAIEAASPGRAWEVAGWTPAGDQLTYFLVPLLDEAGAARGTALLSATDGSLMQVTASARPMPFYPVTLDDALESARRSLLPDETLLGGELTWSPLAGNKYSKSPHLPYYNFYVMGPQGDYRGELFVTLNGGLTVRAGRDGARDTW